MSFIAFKDHLAPPLTHWVAWGRPLNSMGFSFLYRKMEKYTYFTDLSLTNMNYLYRIDRGSFFRGCKDNKMAECSIYLPIFPLLSLLFIWFHWYCICPSILQIGYNYLLISLRRHVYVEMFHYHLCHFGFFWSPSFPSLPLQSNAQWPLALAGLHLSTLLMPHLHWGLLPFHSLFQKKRIEMQSHILELKNR